MINDGKSSECLIVSLPLLDLNMRAETSANTREECLSLRAKGAKGGLGFMVKP